MEHGIYFRFVTERWPTPPTLDCYFGQNIVDVHNCLHEVKLDISKAEEIRKGRRWGWGVGVGCPGGPRKAALIRPHH